MTQLKWKLFKRKRLENPTESWSSSRWLNITFGLIKDFSKNVRFGKLFRIPNVRKNFKGEKCLTNALVLALPGGGDSFVIDPDASKDGLECTLTIHDEVIVYASRKLKHHERE